MTNDEILNDNVENIPEENKVLDQRNNEKLELKESKRKKQSKNSKKKQIMLIVIYIIVIIGITVELILLKINSIKKSSKGENKIETLLSTNDKKEDPDVKFVLSNYTDTYNQNDLEIKYIYDNDGKIESEENYKAKKRISYIEISGLKNETIQKKINDEIRSLSYSMTKDKENFAFNVIVYGNFSNILSLTLERLDRKKDNEGYDTIYNSETVCLNYDLNTGENIDFEKVFTASTPIASIIADAAYEVMAWDTELSMDMSEEEYDKNSNMDRRDTSEYEEKLLAIINEYNGKKAKIDYCISPSRLYIYNLGDFDRTMTVDLAEYRDYVAIYRRYADDDIFKNDNIGIKNVIAFTGPINSVYNIGMYGKLTDNCFVDFGAENVSVYNISLNQNVNEKITIDIKNKVQEVLERTKNKANENSNKGYVVEGYIFDSYYNNHLKEYEPFIETQMFYGISEMSKTYFDNDLFKKYVELQYIPRADMMGSWLLYNSIDGITSTKNNITFYYDLDGNYLGDKESDLIKKQVKVPVIDVVETDNNQNNESNNKEEIQIVSPYS